VPGLAQEVLIPAIPGQLSAIPDHSRKSSEAQVNPDTIELPFFDDFSGRGVLPDGDFWTDDYAFINNSYTTDQITIGIATLDAVDAQGNLNSTESGPFISDYLTSRYINLAYPARDDIYLSFYYQPAGLGDYPDEQDSLAVDFWDPDSNRWETAWSQPGYSRDSTPLDDNQFRQAVIHVQEDRYLKKGFRFRFRNYASPPDDQQYADQAGNVDHWHLDYVYLDTARTASQTAIHDVSMISPLPSMLKTYESLPWTHFAAARFTEIKKSLEITYRNNDTTARNVTRILLITDPGFDITDSVNAGTANLIPEVLYSFQIPFVYPFSPYEADTVLFDVMSYLITGEQDFKSNDTVVRTQVFSNYYAYDDGSAENGYGLRGEGTLGGRVACRFESFETDTLWAVQMYFNRTLGDASREDFILAVWDHDDVNGEPGELLYRVDGLKPEYAEQLNSFTTYMLDTVLVLSGYFYVGWIKTSEFSLNVGFDHFNNNKDKIYYNTGQAWNNTGFSGSLMLRPLMGKMIDLPAGLPERSELQVGLFPNPARDYFRLDWPPGENPAEWDLALIDLQGRIHYRAKGDQVRFSTEQLTRGMYILRLNHSNRRVVSRKLMILK